MSRRYGEGCTAPVSPGAAPRPVLGPCDPERERKLREIRDLLAGLPANEVAVFQDEVDVHLNPKIGSCWMERGNQAEVVTPGQNVKRHLAGSLVWGTGGLPSPPRRRSRAASTSSSLKPSATSK
jgi:hypothetical protein